MNRGVLCAKSADRQTLDHRTISTTWGRALKHIGRQLIDLIPKIYDNRRVITILREDDSEEQIQIDPNHTAAFTDGQKGTKKLKIFNPTYGKYGVTVTIGPSFATKRMEAGESMMAFAKAMPNVAALIADLIAKNMDWEGSEEMAARLAKAVPPQFLTPDQKDIPPQVQAIMTHMDQQIKQLTQQLQQAMAALNDKDKDRAVALEKISKDFEAKMLASCKRPREISRSTSAHMSRTLRAMCSNSRSRSPAISRSRMERQISKCNQSDGACRLLNCSVQKNSAHCRRSLFATIHRGKCTGQHAFDAADTQHPNPPGD